jgi:hypothetical protein
LKVSNYQVVLIHGHLITAAAGQVNQMPAIIIIGCALLEIGFCDFEIYLGFGIWCLVLCLEFA